MGKFLAAAQDKHDIMSVICCGQGFILSFILFFETVSDVKMIHHFTEILLFPLQFPPVLPNFHVRESVCFQSRMTGSGLKAVCLSADVISLWKQTNCSWYLPPALGPDNQPGTVEVESPEIQTEMRGINPVTDSFPVPAIAPDYRWLSSHHPFNHRTIREAEEWNQSPRAAGGPETIMQLWLIHISLENGSLSPTSSHTTQRIVWN